MLIVKLLGRLIQDFEYQFKFFGCYGCYFGKGVVLKVMFMVCKGFFSEFYVVKEFCVKFKSEIKDEYEKKIKFEYSIVKSLYYLNIVEMISFCIDYGCWNYVMEYCFEGDLFSFVKKKYLMYED